MNRFKCPACGRNQYTSKDEAEGCTYCIYKDPLDSIILNELIPRCTPKAAELLKSGLLGVIKVCAVNECIHVQKNKESNESGGAGEGE